MKKLPLGVILFLTFLIGLMLTVIIVEFISKSKEVIVLNSDNIVNQIENNRTFGQYFKLEQGTYTVCKRFFVGHKSVSSTRYGTIHDFNFFIIQIHATNTSPAYYMAINIQTEKDKTNELLDFFESEYTIDLTGMISDLSHSFGSIKVIDEFHSALTNDESNILEYCMNVNSY